MKKTLVWVFFAIVSGTLLGVFTFNRYKNIDTINTIKLDNEVYALKYKSFSNTNEMYDKVISFDRFIFIETENKVTTYVAISKTKKNIQKLHDLYKNKNIKLTMEKIIIENDEFIQNLNEYEKLLDASNDDKSLMIIENQILSCYEDLVVENE